MADLDYYQILGVDKSASDAEIKKAYRKVAMKYHPEDPPDPRAAEEKLKEAAEAYEVLRDPEKRQRYDQFGKAGVNGQGGFEGGQGFTDIHDIFSHFSDIFGGMGGGFGGFGGFGGESAAPQQYRGGDLRFLLADDDDHAFRIPAFGEAFRSAAFAAIHNGLRDHWPDACRFCSASYSGDRWRCPVGYWGFFGLPAGYFRPER